MQKSKFRLAFLIGVLLLGACNVFKPTDDKAITTNIQAKLFNDPVLKTRDIHVDSSHGIVTVSGVVGTDLEKTAVERLATQEKGVKNVVDLLSVGTQSATGPEGVQSAESAAPAQPPAPTRAPKKRMAPAKPPHKHHAETASPQVASKQDASSQVASKQDKASEELEAYTNSITPQTPANPVPAPTPAAAAPAPAAPAPVAAPAPPPAPAPAPKPQEHVTIPSGTVVTIRMIDNIDSSRNQAGEDFAATLDSPIVVDDRVVASRGSDARVRLAKAQSAGRISGQSELQLELTSLTIKGVTYPTKSGYYAQHGASRGTRSAETIGGGAVLGALIGGLLGHGKGAAIGSVAGAGAGTAVQVSTKGQQIKVPSETKIDFTLNDPVSVPVGGSQ